MSNDILRLTCDNLDCDAFEVDELGYRLFLDEAEWCMNCERCPICCACVDVQCTANNCGQILEPLNELSMHEDRDLVYARYYCKDCSRQHRVTFAPISVEQDH